MLFRKFEPISIKIGFFMNFLSYSKIGPKSLYYSIDQNLLKMARREFFIFIIFSDAYTCSYVV